MKKYYNFTINKAVNVNNLITLEYLNLSANFTYPKESHNFYEFAYVDNGSLICSCQEKSVTLSQGDFFLIKPNQEHSYSVKSKKPTSVFIVCFSCNSSMIEILNCKTTVKSSEKAILAKILSEAHKTFKFPFDKKLITCDNPAFGAQQIIKNSIEEILICLVRRFSEKDEIKIVTNNEELENNIVKDVLTILNQNIYNTITLEDISKRLFYSKTYLNKIFKKNIGTTIKNYYLEMKIEESKKMLKNGESVTTVSNKLQFDAPNYFSKFFKNKVGILPSKYKGSII